MTLTAIISPATPPPTGILLIFIPGCAPSAIWACFIGGHRASSSDIDLFESTGCGKGGGYQGAGPRWMRPVHMAVSRPMFILPKQGHRAHSSLWFGDFLIARTVTRIMYSNIIVTTALPKRPDARRCGSVRLTRSARSHYRGPAPERIAGWIVICPLYVSMFCQ